MFIELSWFCLELNLNHLNPNIMFLQIKSSPHYNFNIVRMSIFKKHGFRKSKTFFTAMAFEKYVGICHDKFPGHRVRVGLNWFSIGEELHSIMPDIVYGCTSRNILVNFGHKRMQINHFSFAYPIVLVVNIWQTDIFCKIVCKDDFKCKGYYFEKNIFRCKSWLFIASHSSVASKPT